MNISRYNCIICHIPFDDTIHLPRILNKCGHTICSLCISKKLLTNKTNTFSCPKDNTIYSKIENIDYFQINKDILEKIKENKNDSYSNNNINMNDSTKFDNILMEKVSFPTQKITKTKIDTITINDNTNSNTILSSMNNNQNNQQCYMKKIIKFGKKLKFSKNSLICSIHSLPLNIICVNDQQKICSQCALNNIHLNHQIIQENKFIEYIDELVKVYQEIENNINIFGDITNINTELILEKIDRKINKFKNNIIKICEELIENINAQCKQIGKYLDLRKNELFNKYQFNNCDMNNLRETTNNWIEITCDKLTKASSGNLDELNIESLKLLDSDQNKNIFSLINLGKQLNERYNFINETKDIIDKLNEFHIKGLNVEPNYNIIDSIMTSSTINEGRKDTKIYNNYNYNESIINTKGNNISTLGNNNINNKSININFNSNSNILETSLFKVEENKDIIDSLNLTPISFLYKQTKNIFISYENDDLDNLNDPCNTVSNLSNLYPPKLQLSNNNINLNKNVYSKKNINSNHEYDTFKNELYITLKKTNMSKTNTNFFDSSKRINFIDLKDYPKSRQNNNLELNGNMRHKTQYDIREKNINISQTFKRILYPKLEKVKTCDVVFIASNKRKKSKDKDSFIFTDSNNLKNEKTTNKLPLSPKLKSVYNIISKNMKKDTYSPKRDINSKNNNKNKKNINKSNIIKENKNEKNIENKDINKSKRNEIKKYKTKYIRCVSCSSSLNKKDIQDISILFNLKEKDKDKVKEHFSPELYQKKNYIYNNQNINSKDMDIDKESDLSIITNNNVSQCSHHLNKSCIKKNSKTYYNFKNNKSNRIKTKNLNINSSFISKTQSDLLKIINNQMKKNNPLFNRINMRGVGIQLLCSYMEKNKKNKYKEMKLPGCNLNDDDFCLLVKSLIENEIEVPVLNLSYNKISDNSAKYIFEIIKKKISLKNIYLYNNIFSKSFIDKLKNYNKDKNVDCVKLFT